MDLAKAILSAPGDDITLHDSLHIGGRRATQDFLATLDITPGARILDAGCGLGGVARAAGALGAKVLGVDLNPDYIAAAQVLTDNPDVRFQIGNVLQVPVSSMEFDIALSVHVSMNVADKTTLYQEMARVLRPKGILAIYDVFMLQDGGAMTYPLPWASGGADSFLVSVDSTIQFLEMAGFEITGKIDCTEFATQSLEKAMESGQFSIAAPPDFGIRIANLAVGIANRHCAVWQILAQKKQA